MSIRLSMNGRSVPPGPVRRGDAARGRLPRPVHGRLRADPEQRPAGPTKVKVAYLGLTCEAAMFVAQEKGFFKEEGLDVEFVKTDWDGLRDGLGLGRFDANYTLIMYLLKPIEQGLDVKITGGIHSGCLRVQAGVKTRHQVGRGPQGQEDRRAHRTWAARRSCSPAASWPPTAWTPARQEGRRMGRPSSRTCWAWRWTTGRSTRWPTPSRSARSCSATGQGADDRRPGRGPAVQGRILLRRGRQREARQAGPGGGREGDAGAAQGGQVGRGRTRRPRPSCRSRRSTSRPRRRSTPTRSRS